MYDTATGSEVKFEGLEVEGVFRSINTDFSSDVGKQPALDYHLNC